MHPAKLNFYLFLANLFAAMNKKRYVVGILVLSTLYLAQFSFGQSVKMNISGADVHVKTGTTLNVTDIIIGTASATDGEITNEGTINVSGDWTNNNTGGGGVFTSNQGTVNMDGASVQNIGGSTQTDFNNLTFATGSSNKQLGVNTLVGGGFASPSGVLTLNNTTLLLNSTTLTLSNPATTALSNSGGGIRSETTPVAGYGIVDWEIGVGTGNYVVPFRTASGGDITFEYDVDNAAGIGAGTVKFATYPTPGNNLPLPTGVTHLHDANQADNSDKVYNRFWVIDPTGYTTNPKGKYVFHYLASEIDAATEANLRAQRFNPTATPISPGNNGQWGDWLYSPAPNIATKTITLTIQNTADYFDVWTLADNGQPLPIELVSFVGDCDGYAATLQWTTASEINVSHFEIERTLDGITFEKIDEVVAIGFSNQMRNYQYKDKNPITGVAYYRLKTIDNDGTFEYSRLISVGCQSLTGDVIFNFQNAYNSDDDYVNLLFTANQNDEFNATLYDISGKLIAEALGKAGVNGVNNHRMFVGPVSPGIYVIKLINEGRVFNKKLFFD